jgi:hypothetical protein
MLTKDVVVDRIEVTEAGTVQVRWATFIVEDGVRLPNPAYHRIAYAPGEDVSAEHARVQAVAGALWTPDVVKAYRGRAGGPQNR